MADKDDEFVGYIDASNGADTPGNCTLLEIAVLPKHRRSGIGRRLVLDIATWLQEDGFETVWVNPLDERIEWFERMGFQAPDSHTYHSVSLAQLVANLSQE